MKYEEKTKKQLMSELAELRGRTDVSLLADLALDIARSH